MFVSGFPKSSDYLTTEILTNDGWMNINDVTTNHKIAVMSSDGNTYYDYPTSVSQKKYKITLSKIR